MQSSSSRRTKLHSSPATSSTSMAAKPTSYFPAQKSYFSLNAGA
jgi:hypothetical protein